MSNDHTLRAQIIPYGQLNLLLPNSAVAEVTRLVNEVIPHPTAPKWVYGVVEWRGLSLPLVSVEGLLDMSITPIDQIQRLVVLNCIGPNSRTPFIATAATNNPHLLKLQQEMLEDEQLSEHDSRYVHYSYPIEQTTVLIPDLLAIEESLQQI